MNQEYKTFLDKLKDFVNKQKHLEPDFQDCLNKTLKRIMRDNPKSCHKR